MKPIDTSTNEWRVGVAAAWIRLRALYPHAEPLIVVLSRNKRKEHRKRHKEAAE